jgi:hypothetical protein
VLKALGLRDQLDKPTILACARRIERSSALDPVPFSVANRAAKLLKHFLDNPDVTDKVGTGSRMGRMMMMVVGACVPRKDDACVTLVIVPYTRR